MPLNPYFQNSKGGFVESNLYENLIVESIQINGNLFYYIPRKLNNFDRFYGDDLLSSFDTAIPVEMYIENVNGYDGESEMISKFGLEIRDSASLVIARKRWLDSVQPLLDDSGKTDIQKRRPNEGDLVYFPITKSLFEIKFVEDDEPFYQLEKKYIWKLRVELFQYNNEKIETGDFEVDSIFDSLNRNRLDLTFLTEDGNAILTEDGGIIALESFNAPEELQTPDLYGDSETIDSEFNRIVDFSEDNPFSERF